MFPIIDARPLGKGGKQFEIAAARIARSQKPGQFVILRLHEHGERIPLTMKGCDPKKGSITIVVQAIGKTMTELNAMNTGDAILDVVGPLGKPSGTFYQEHARAQTAALIEQRHVARESRHERTEIRRRSVQHGHTETCAVAV